MPAGLAVPAASAGLAAPAAASAVPAASAGLAALAVAAVPAGSAVGLRQTMRTLTCASLPVETSVAPSLPLTATPKVTSTSSGAGSSAPTCAATPSAAARIPLSAPFHVWAAARTTRSPAPALTSPSPSSWSATSTYTRPP